MATTKKTPRRSRPVGAGLRARLRYQFDNVFSRGPSAVMALLGIGTVAVIVLVSAMITGLRLTGVNGGDSLGFVESLWLSFLRVTGKGFNDKGWGARAIGLVVALASIFITSTFIGLLTSSVNQRITALRKGRSAVVEHDHTLILGWSNRITTIVSELVVANESRKRAVVVILADVDKTKMEDTLRDAVGDLRTTKVVCRTGDPSLPVDLERVNINGARSVVVIGGNDAVAVTTLLAVRAAGRGIVGAPIVAELKSVATANTVRALFGQRVVVLSSEATVAELTAQACRQQGLGQVFRELLDFDGDEVYLAPFPELVGRCYAEAQLAFEYCAILGIRTAAGDVELNPSPARLVEDGDELIGIASDDSAFVCTGVRRSPRQLVPYPSVDLTPKRRTVLVDWSSLGARVVEELDHSATPDSTLELIVDPAVVDVEALRRSLHVRNLRVEISTPTSRPEAIAAQAALTPFDEAIVLSRRDGSSAGDADARTLLTLLALHKVVEDRGMGHVRVVAELLEERHGPLAQATGTDDFIVSDGLTSLLIAQIAERHELDQVFRILFDPSGPNVELAPTDRYSATEAGCFADVVASASYQGHSAVGFRRAQDGVVVLNPPKSTPLALRRADEIVVLRPSRSVAPVEIPAEVPAEVPAAGAALPAPHARG